MKIKLLRQRNPAYNGSRLEECRALYEGGELWERVRRRFIPQQQLETDDEYNKRLAQATYTSHTGAIVDLLAAFLFVEPPTVADAPSTWWDGWQKNVDRAGSSLAWWARSVFVDAMVGRRAWAFVNLPAAEPAEYADQAAQEKAGALDAFLVALAPELVIDWGFDASGQLAWVMVEDEICERTSVEMARTKILRWRYIDGTAVRTWHWTPTPEKPTPNDDDDAPEQAVVRHGRGRCPVARLELPPGLYALGKLRDPAIDHLRARNGLSWALDLGAHPLLTIMAKDRITPALGPGYHLNLGIDEKAAYAEPGGACFQLLADDVGRLREDLYRVVQQMATAADPKATAAKQSGESKDRDWQAAEIVLAAYAELVLDWLRKVLVLVAETRGEDATGLTVAGLTGWQSDDLATWLEQAAQAIDARMFSPTFRKTVAKREAARLLGDEDPKVLETIRNEIDAADATDPAPYAPPPRPGVPGGGTPRKDRRDPRAPGR